MTQLNRKAIERELQREGLLICVKAPLNLPEDYFVRDWTAVASVTYPFLEYEEKLYAADQRQDAEEHQLEH